MLRQQRVVIDRVTPQINGGEFYIKRVVGQSVKVNADVLVDGHDVIAASVLFKHQSEKRWQEQRMEPGFNDSWHGTFQVEKQGMYSYKVQGWVDHALNWQYGIGRKIADNQHVNSELLEGAELLDSIMNKTKGEERKYLKDLAASFRDPEQYGVAIEEAVGVRLQDIFVRYPDKKLASVKPKSVVKRMKEKKFAASVRRENIMECEQIGIPLPEFVQLSLGAMQGISDRLGL